MTTSDVPSERLLEAIEQGVQRIDEDYPARKNIGGHLADIHAAIRDLRRSGDTCVMKADLRIVLRAAQRPMDEDVPGAAEWNAAVTRLKSAAGESLH
jgi:hypothetical protein